MAGTQKVYNPDTGQYEDAPDLSAPSVADPNQPGGYDPSSFNTPGPGSPAIGPLPTPNGQPNAQAHSFTPGQAGDPAYDANPRDYMVNRDSGSWEAQLKQRLGGLYDPSILQGVQSNVGYAQNAGRDPQSIIDAVVRQNLARQTNTPNSGGQQQAPNVLNPSSGGLQAGVAGGGSQDGLLQQLIQQQMASAKAQQDQYALMQKQYNDQAASKQQFNDSIRQQLMGLIKSGSEQANPDQIANSPEARSYQRLQERQLANFRSRAAEQQDLTGNGAVQGGGVGGGLGQNVAQGEQQLGENLYGQQSQLVARELQAKRQQLSQALSMGAGILSQDQQQALQQQLATMDAAIQQTQGAGQLSLGLLGQQNQSNQFYDQLGSNIGYQQALLNQNAYGSLGG